MGLKMRSKKITEADRKAIIRAMSAARKIGYFAKYNFKNDRNIAQDALSAMGVQNQFIYSINDRCDNQMVCFYWSGNGKALVDLLRAEGLTVEWPDSPHQSIIVKLQSAA